MWFNYMEDWICQTDASRTAMRSFYASVEMLLNPELRGKAVAVCGSTEDRHGIVLGIPWARSWA